MKKLLVVALLALGIVPVAQAGCWATVTLSSLPKTRVWAVNVTPLQHGRTTILAATPRIEIRQGSGAWTVFAARRTAKPGVYRARVVFPKVGRWQFRVWDGFERPCARYHNYAAVTITDV